MSLKTVIGFVITILSVILLIPGCTSSSQKNISSIKHGTTLSGSGGKIYKTYILNTPLGPINEEVIHNAKENVQTLFEKLKNETDETQKKLIRQELAFAKMNYDELLPIPFKSQLPQTGKRVTVAVIDSGISSKTIQHLESKFIDYYEMAPDYSIEKKNKAKLLPFKLFSILDCPWVIPAGAVDPENNSRKTRYDPTNRYKALYVPARSSSVAAAKVSGLIALLLEKNPSMTPYQIKKISLETADYHEEENGRKVYSINITKAMKSIK